MTLFLVALRNLGRNKLRNTLTILGAALTVLSFLLLRTVLSAWTAGADLAVKDRLVTRHKVTFVMTLPKRYVDDARNIEGVRQVSYMNWFGARDPRDENDFFATMAVDGPTILKVYDEIKVSKEDYERWMQDRQGAIIGDGLAKKKGWKVGDRVSLEGTIYPGTWTFTIDGIYTVSSKIMDRTQLFFHWNYLNESITNERMKDQVGWIVARVDDPRRTADVARRIDEVFDVRDIQTLSQDERAFNASFLAAFAIILDALDVGSAVILLIMALILGNTIAMAVRERTNEYAVLRAIGFSPGHIAFFVVGEAFAVGVLGGLVGLGVSYPFINGFGRVIEEQLGSIFPRFEVDPMWAAVAFGLAVVLGLVASVVPARRAFRLDIVQALRRVG